MSRKATDLSGEKLTRVEKLKKFFTKSLPRWFYNKEKGTLLGERQPLQWGKLLLYYLCFYTGLVVFFIICYVCMRASIPERPDNLYFCSTDDSSAALWRCHDGPRFKTVPVGQLDGNAKTNDIMRQSLIVPTLATYPANLYIGRDTLTANNVEANSAISAPTEVSAHQVYNWGHVEDEARRGSCGANDADVAKAQARGLCDSTIINHVIPRNIPKELETFTNSPLEDSTNTLNATKFVNVQDFLMGPRKSLPGDLTFQAPLPYVTDRKLNVTNDGTSREVSVNIYLVFFRLNKMWNYMPMDSEKRGSTAANKANVVNDIGAKCYFNRKGCKTGEKGVNYKGESVTCETGNRRDGSLPEAGTLSANGALKIDMINNVMSKKSGFPWEGGAYDLSFGSFFVTWDRSKDIGTKNERSYIESPIIRCEWGVGAPSGTNANGTSFGPIKRVRNKHKEGYGGSTLTTVFPSADMFVYQFN